VTRYLLGGHRLAQLESSRELAPPEAVVGLSNRLIARAHLAAAMHESDQDFARLVHAFGLPLVEEALGQGFTPDRFRVTTSEEGVVRAGLVPRTQEDPGDPIQATVTGRTVAVVDRESGSRLIVVDGLTAPTRFYPRRVFAWKGRRFEVPLHAHDAKRDRIEVEPVAASVPFTSPKLVLDAKRKRRVEALEQFTRGRFTYSTCTFEIICTERVVGAQQGSRDHVEYDAVTATYLTRGRAIFFDRSASVGVLEHLAASFEDTLGCHLLLRAEDMSVIAVPAEWSAGSAAGILVVERQVQGLGIAETLDGRRINRAFDWVNAIARACECVGGCTNCTPSRVVEHKAADKQGVLALLAT
jgi:hypothetical protein